jgi:hypothetical protein
MSLVDLASEVLSFRSRAKRLATVAQWTLSVRPTCTPRAGPCQIGVELGVTATTVSHQLRRAGVTMRRGAAPSLKIELARAGQVGLSENL